MAMLCEPIPRDKVATADALLAQFGFGERLQDWIDQIDFDPDSVLDQIDTLVDAHDALVPGQPPPCAQMFAGASWEGDAHDVACEDVECQRSFWDQVLDFILWIAQQLVQILDYIVDILRRVVAWITWLALALSLVALAIVVAATLLSFGPGIITAVIQGPAFAVLGAISLVGTAVSLIPSLSTRCSTGWSP